MMKLSSIKIQGMHKVQNKTYDLSGFRYFHGNNGAGKSTVMQAIQLALLGYIPGTDKNKSAIFKHSNGPVMHIELVINDNGHPIVITRSWQQKGKDISAYCDVQPPIYDTDGIVGSLELPVFNFSNFIDMSANKLKDWFINFLPAANSNIDWDTELNQAISGFSKILDTQFVNDMISHVKDRSSKIHGVQLIRAFNSYLKEQQSFYKTDLARVQNTVQSLIYHNDCDDSQSIEELKSANQAAQMHIDNLNSKLLKIQQNESISADLKSVKNDVTATSVQEDEMYKAAINVKSNGEKQLAVYDERLSTLKSRQAAVQAEYNEKKRIVESGGNCPYTCAECTTIANMISAFNHDMVKLESELNDLDTQINKVDINIAKTKDIISTTTTEIARISHQYLTYETLSKQIYTDVTDMDKESVLTEINQLKYEIQQRQDTIIKLEANKRYEELTDRLTNDKYRIEQNIEILKIWIKLTDVNGLQSHIMNAPFEVLAENMTVYLRSFFHNDNLTAKFILSEKANSFSFGIVQFKGEYIGFDLLSSGEKCLYTLALLLSIVESSDAPLKLIMIDDLLDHLDTAKIKDCFETLYNIESIQILLAGVQNCTHSHAEEFVIEVTTD